MTGKLVKSTILVRCSDDTHFDCTPVKDAIFDLAETTEAYTTVAPKGSPEYCVAATAVTTRSKVKLLEKKIHDIKINSPKKLHIKDIVMYTGRP